MKLYSNNNDYKLYQGSMLDMLEVIESNTIDSVICDPPYELNFMAKSWDNSGIAFQPDTWQKCYDVLKPGGYLLAFGGSRTFHRIACAIEDAGFEIRDTIMWLYGSGFPKSMDISKQIDKRNGRTNNEFIELGKYLKEKIIDSDSICAERMGFSPSLVRFWKLGERIPNKETWLKLKDIYNLDNTYDWLIEREEAKREVIGTKKVMGKDTNDIYGKYKGGEIDITIPSTDLAKQWQGWGTALKPSFEPIIVARKPFKGSLVDNVIEYGVGGINIDECRVGNTTADTYDLEKRQISKATGSDNDGHFLDELHNKDAKHGVTDLGRFPANTILTYDETPSDERLRYFYCAKASKKDRDEGLDEFEEKTTGELQGGRKEGSAGSIMLNADGTTRVNPYAGTGTPKKNTHPTVKPTELMQYLVRLVTPNNGTVLDPFNGSGSTGKAVMFENKERSKNYKYIGIELTEEYLPIAKARIEYVCKDSNTIENLKENTEEVIEGQTNIFDYL